MKRAEVKYVSKENRQQKKNAKPPKLANIMHNPPLHSPPFIVISGGQTGADTAGLKAALSLGIPTGGVAPKAYKTEDGPNEDLRDLYNLKEGPAGYPSRTRMNVDLSQGTVAFRLHVSNGTDKTIVYARERRWAGDAKKIGSKDDGYRPVLVVTDMDRGEHWEEEIVSFVERNAITVLNIAGHRETTAGVEDFEAKVCELLSRALKRHLGIQ